AAAAFGHTASAQAPMSPLDAQFPPVAPPPTGYPGQPTYTPIAPDAASPAGYPPGMEPWPAISPYDHAVDTTYNDRGIWFREMLNHNRKYKLTAEFISGRSRQPGNVVVGADVLALDKSPFEDDLTPASVPSQFDQEYIAVKEFEAVLSFGRFFSTGGAVTGGQTASILADPPLRGAFNVNSQFLTPPSGNQQGGQAGAGPIDFTFPTLKQGLAPVVNLNGDITITDSADETPTDEVSGTLLFTATGGVLAEDAVTRFGGFDDIVHEHKQNPASPGLRLVFGLEDEDESGFDWTGWWLSGQEQTFSRGTDDPARPRVTNVVLFDSAFTTADSRGLPSDLPTYEILDYNRLFRLTHESQTASTDLAFYHTPMVDYGWLVLRPLYGARYTYVGEKFNFTGRDNGLFIVYEENGSPQDGKVLDVNPGAATPYSLFPYETSVTSEVQSHLYGPQIGLDLKLGGEHFTITSAAKTGVVASTERLTLDGYGFGFTEALTGERVFFSDAKTHTRVVPFLEFNANAEINIFPIIPVLNRSPLFKNARLRTGWSGLVVGNMQRPMEQIVWRSETAGGGYIKERGRDAWYTQYWNVGVNWTF
ncbi:MAG: hypothetical protein M3552_17075, partial [Planctomycetota bacterium]|nr:hypothetical protein [Planctomycetota bacterium]